MLRYLVVCAILLQPGCATIFGHRDHSMRVTSTPAGATVYLNGAPVEKTPVDFPVDDLGTPNTLKVRLEGYDDESERVMRKVQTVAFCNLFNFICWGVDYLSDSMFEIKNDTLHFDLRAYRPGAVPPPGPPGPGPAPAPGAPPALSPTAPVEALPPPTPMPPAPPPSADGEESPATEALSAPPLVPPPPP